MGNIEVEVRSFISDQQYAKLITFFDSHAKLIQADDQETLYFDCAQDLRIQCNSAYAKIWLKKGKIHDDAREEIEIRCKKEDYTSLLTLFTSLGYKIKIKWLRKRRQYEWKDITVCVDDTKGYGKILELEIMTDEEKKQESKAKLLLHMHELGIAISPKEEFTKRFQEYEKNWKQLIT